MSEEKQARKDRSDKFREWVRTADDRQVEKLVHLEKNVRILLHVWDLIGEVDVKALHNMARVAHSIREEYENQ